MLSELECAAEDLAVVSGNNNVHVFCNKTGVLVVDDLVELEAVAGSNSQTEVIEFYTGPTIVVVKVEEERIRCLRGA